MFIVVVVEYFKQCLGEFEQILEAIKSKVDQIFGQVYNLVKIEEKTIFLIFLQAN